jgi:hypothetical protein
MRDTVYVWSLEHEGNPCLGEFADTEEDAVFYIDLDRRYKNAPNDCVFVGTVAEFSTYLKREN